jgi:glycosyltransferase involved in cell wall biosynthesis
MRNEKHIHLIDELQIGGAQTHLVTVLRESLKSYSIDHRVIALFGNGPIAEELELLGIPVDAVDLRPLLAAKRFGAAAAVLGNLFESYHPDLVEAHLTWSRLLGTYAAWRMGIPRRFGFEQGDIYLNSWKFRAANYVSQYFEDQIICCSHALAHWAHQTHGISMRRIAVLHNCVDVERFQPSYARGPLDFGFPAGSTIFCAVGTLGNGVNKRMDVCIRAIAEARAQGAEVALVICGDGPQRPDLERLAAQLGVGPVVRLLGMQRDVRRALASSDAFCHAAPFEPFGIVCIEAMAMGLPVIVPNSGGIAEAVEEGTTGFVYPALDHEALARAMLRLSTDAERRRAMGKQARRAAEERFSVRAYVGRLYELYGNRD